MAGGTALPHSALSHVVVEQARAAAGDGGAGGGEEGGGRRGARVWLCASVHVHAHTSAHIITSRSGRPLLSNATATYAPTNVIL